MPKSLAKTREEARRLYLTGEAPTNAEIAARLRVKPHTIGKWRREEDWDDLRAKIDVRAAQMFVDKIASDRTSLNVRHYRMWDLLVVKLAESLKAKPTLETRELERISAILNRAQQGQRLAKGLSLTGETEEAIRAQSEAELRRVIDGFVDAVKENVHDEETRERIRQSIIRALPEASDADADESDDPLPHHPAR